MSKPKPTKLSLLNAQLIKLRGEINEIEEAEVRPIRESLIGKCFKYRNCYSMPQKPGDYFYLYMKILGIKGGCAVTDEFQIDKFGHITVKPAHKGHYFPENTILRGDYIEITEKEYLAAKNKMKKILAEF